MNLLVKVLPRQSMLVQKVVLKMFTRWEPFITNTDDLVRDFATVPEVIGGLAERKPL